MRRTMQSIQGTYKNGVIQLDEPVNWEDGQPVTITAIENGETDEETMSESEWEQFDRIIEECKMETGITDLAHQHDHYLYGTPKKDIDEV